MKIYLACPFSEGTRKDMFECARILEERFHDVYVPARTKLENDWDWPNNEWGLQVFINNVEALKQAEFVVVLNYGRELTTAGTSWEQGFAYGIGKKILLVEMTDNIQSLMTANGRYATIKGLEELKNYSFEHPKPLRTNTEQK